MKQHQILELHVARTRLKRPIDEATETTHSEAIFFFRTDPKAKPSRAQGSRVNTEHSNRKPHVYASSAMLLKALFAIFILTGTAGASFSANVQCNISERQMKSLRSLLCKTSDNLKDHCFEEVYQRRYMRLAVEVEHLRNCGYVSLAEQYEAATSKFADIVEPLGQCINEHANLHEIYRRAKLAAQSKIEKTCSSEGRTIMEARVPEVRKLVETMHDTGAVKKRLYTLLGVIAPNQ